MGWLLLLFSFFENFIKNIVIIGSKESPKKIENNIFFENCLYENCQKNDKWKSGFKKMILKGDQENCPTL